MSARILVVDDEPQIGRLLKTSLGARGYAVAVASDGQAALDMAASWRPDLMLLDAPGLTDGARYLWLRRALPRTLAP